MTRWLKQSTAVDVPIGPFLDATDGVTAESGLTITQPDVRLKKNGGAWAQKAAAQTLSHEENGNYEVTLDATDTDTLGLLRLHVAESGALPVWEDFMVVPANVWDSLFGADTLQVDVAQWLGTAPATPTVAGVPEVDVTHVAGSATTATLDTIKTETASILTDTAEIGAAGAGLTVLATAANLATAQADLDVLTGADGVTLATSQPNYAPATAASLATTDGKVDDILTDTGTTLPATLATASDLATVDSNVDAIKAKTDSLTFTVAGQVDANIESVNGTTVTGSGTTGDPWGP